MSRWTPDARRRLQDAALELFTEQGYAAMTVAAVAGRAGLTERTFFRYFDDKKEVLFIQNDFAELMAARTATSAATSALGMATEGLREVADMLQAEASRVRRRARVIATAPELRKRELLKTSEWTVAVTEALKAEQVEPQAAQIAAEVATALFRIAYGSWTADVDDAELVGTFNAVVDVHRSITVSVPRTVSGRGRAAAARKSEASMALP